MSESLTIEVVRRREQEAQEFVERLRRENPDGDAYVLALERQLVERLRVNLGLLVENKELKRRATVPEATTEMVDKARYRQVLHDSLVEALTVGLEPEDVKDTAEEVLATWEDARYG